MNVSSQLNIITYYLHIIIYSYWKMIHLKTYYKIRNNEWIDIINTFNNLGKFGNSYKYEVCIYGNNEDICQFIAIESLGFCQV